MSSNVSQAKILSILHRANVSEYATWSLIVACQPCSAVRTVPVATLPQELTVIEALLRMRCRTCRGRVYAAAMDNQVPGWRGRIVKIWGPGSYG